jgi:hypothetical protein
MMDLPRRVILPVALSILITSLHNKHRKREGNGKKEERRKEKEGRKVKEEMKKVKREEAG